MNQEHFDHIPGFTSLPAGGLLLNPARSRSGFFKPGSVRLSCSYVYTDLRDQCTHTTQAARPIPINPGAQRGDSISAHDA